MNLWRKLSGLIGSPSGKGLLTGPPGCCCGGNQCVCVSDPGCHTLPGWIIAGKYGLPRQPDGSPYVFTRREQTECCCVLGGSHPNNCGVRGMITQRVERLSGPGCIGTISYVTSEWSSPNIASGVYFVRNRTHPYNFVTCLEEPVIQRDSSPPTACCNVGTWGDGNWPSSPLAFDFGRSGPLGDWTNVDLISIAGEFHGDCSTLVDRWVAVYNDSGSVLRKTFTLAIYRDDDPNFCGDGGDCKLPCCLPDGTCREDLTEVECLGIGGIPGEIGADCYNAGCDVATPYNGACCDPATGSCVMSTAAGCTAPKVFRGLGTSCATTTCPQPVGNCCKDGNCTIKTQADCSATGGTWGGPNTNCNNPETCTVPGACCTASGCSEVQSAQACTNIGGVFQGPGTLCVGVQCTGACCVQTSHGWVCGQDTASACASQNGVFFPGLPCFPSPCGTGGRGSGGFL